MKGKSSFIIMTFAVVGVVLFVSIFSSIMEQMEVVRTYANISTFTALSTIVGIAPTVLLIGGVFAAGFGYYKGYKGASAQDASGVLRMVFGIVQVILFVALFYTILTSFYTLYLGGATENASFYPAEYTAFRTVTAIGPTILFLTGIFGGVMSTYSGIKTRRASRRRLLR